MCMARLARQTQPTPARIASPCVIALLKAIRAGVGWVWLASLVYGMIVRSIAAWHVP